MVVLVSSDDLETLEEGDDLEVALAVVLDDLAGARASAAATLTISWPAPAQPAAVTPRSAAVTVSTGFDLAAMMPLKLG